MTARVVSTHTADSRPGGSGVARRVPPLTVRDRARIAEQGRPGLLRRLRRRAAAAWVAVAGSTVVGMTSLATSPIEDDTGMWILLGSVPLLVVAAHQQGTLQRIQLNDPDRPVPITSPTRGPGAEDAVPEIEDLTLVRDRLLGTLPALEAKLPGVAAEVRAADGRAFAALEVQGQALAALQGLPVPDNAGSASAAEELRRRMRSGIEQYQELLAECVLLLARGEASSVTDGTLARARDIVATHSEGLRVAEGLNDL